MEPRRRSAAPGPVSALRGAGRPTAPAPTAADEASAEAARRRLLERGIVPIEPDDRVRPMLAADEAVVSIRRAVSLERRTGWQDPGAAVIGDLYLTTQRLLHLGRVRIECPVCSIRDAIVSDGVLLLLVGDDRGMTIHVADPRVLRVEIAATRGAARTPFVSDQAPSR